MEFQHPLFNSAPRRSQSLCNERCQNILYKAVFEHFIAIRTVAALLLASKSFQNSSFGANFLVNYVVDDYPIRLFDSVLSPSSCFSLQCVPSLHIEQPWSFSEESMNADDKSNWRISNFVHELLNTKYLHLSLRSLTLQTATYDVVSFFFGSSSKEWPQLLDLSLEKCGMNNAVLEIISQSAIQLRALNFSKNFAITDAGLEHLSNLSGITSLNLSGCNKITDAGLEHLSNLSGITSLDLASCYLITNAGLEHLSKLSCITSLNLSECESITDDGLERLSKLSHITSLGLLWCDNITGRAKTKFKAAMPNCHINN